ncbi:hypothetical protein AXG93_1467s1310 [Marchantia polymorpha subsp. ruderalis]|uniref:Uncharacterized protein n=1 Tax=Marchantia polymorpha subsp. ruderalis TaxID=1480154 RepID=A0A176WKF5_MARPO|nr:hypothetical protein AXG93_1467s1310 [Marchantia polymorpha subsp. ruderalis]
MLRKSGIRSSRSNKSKSKLSVAGHSSAEFPAQKESQEEMQSSREDSSKLIVAGHSSSEFLAEKESEEEMQSSCEDSRSRDNCESPRSQCNMEEYFHSLQGCEAVRFEFWPGLSFQPSFISFYLKREAPSESVKSKISVWDRSQSHYVDELLEPLEKVVHILSTEVSRGETIRIEEICFKDLQKSSDMVSARKSKSSDATLSWRAFIQVKLKWGTHRAVIGNLIDDVGGGLWPDHLS